MIVIEVVVLELADIVTIRCYIVTGLPSFIN